MSEQAKSILVKKYIEKAMVDLPPMPGTVLQVLAATERPDVTVAQLEKSIVTDPAITTKVLKVVNSAYFGLPQQIGSIGQAVAILGVHQVRNLTLSMGVVGVMQSSNSRSGGVQDKFWKRSFGAAFAAQWLAEEKGLSHDSQQLAFIGGLLHDVGRLFLLSMFPVPYQKVLNLVEDGERPLVAVEREELGLDHAELGGLLAGKWNFPEELREAIALHEGPFEIVQPVHFCINAADRIAQTLSIDPDDAPPQQLDPIVSEWLAMDEPARLELGSRLAGKVKDAAGMLKVA